MERHDTGSTHPERAERLEAFAVGLEAGGIGRTAFLKPNTPSLASIQAVHPRAYTTIVETFCKAIPPGSLGELPTGDTVVSHDSYAIAFAAAGGALNAVAAASSSEPALALIRPPGHHAEPARGMGFCLFNNVAIAAAWALRERGSVLIADFDYHHGNGTQAWVEQVLEQGQRGLGFLSTHAYPAYPGTGGFDESRVSDGGFVIDIPLAHATGTDDFIAVWSSLLPAVVQRIKPQTIIVSAGFDFLAGDPIAGLPIAPRAVDALCGLLGQAAAQGDATLALVLEGGYSLDNLRASGAALATDFGSASARVHVPPSQLPRNERLRSMVSEALGWLR